MYLVYQPVSLIRFHAGKHLGTYDVVRGGLGVEVCGGDDSLGGLWAESVAQDSGLSISNWSWLWSIWRSIRLLDDWDNRLGGLNNWRGGTRAGNDGGRDGIGLSDWADNGGQVNGLGNDINSGILSTASGLSDVLAAVGDRVDDSLVDSQGGKWHGLRRGWGSGHCRGHGLVDGTTVVEAASMAVGVSSSEGREEDGGNSGDMHLGWFISSFDM